VHALYQSGAACTDEDMAFVRDCSGAPASENRRYMSSGRELHGGEDFQREGAEARSPEKGEDKR